MVGFDEGQAAKRISVVGDSARGGIGGRQRERERRKKAETEKKNTERQGPPSTAVGPPVCQHNLYDTLGRIAPDSRSKSHRKPCTDVRTYLWFCDVGRYHVVTAVDAIEHVPIPAGFLRRRRLRLLCVRPQRELHPPGCNRGRRLTPGHGPLGGPGERVVGIEKLCALRFHRRPVQYGGGRRRRRRRWQVCEREFSGSHGTSRVQHFAKAVYEM